MIGGEIGATWHKPNHYYSKVVVPDMQYVIPAVWSMTISRFFLRQPTTFWEGHSQLQVVLMSVCNFPLACVGDGLFVARHGVEIVFGLIRFGVKRIFTFTLSILTRGIRESF